MSDTYSARMTPEGRVLIPSALRRAAGLSPGAIVGLRVEDGDIVITSPDSARRQLRGIFRDVGRSLADELIADRRVEAAAEAPPAAPGKRPRARRR